jgi:GTP pyrophosphokinase
VICGKGTQEEAPEFQRILKEERLQEVAKRFSFNTVSDLLAAVGDAVVTAGQVINRIKEIYFSDAQVEDILRVPVNQEFNHKNYNAALSIKGVDDVAIRLAHCCNPLPGDRVLGYITRGRGVSVHRTDCPNLQNYLRHEKERVIEVEWADCSGKCG